VLFYGPQRVKAFAGPLDPASAADWHELDDDHNVHVDLHGIFLSPDFRATFENGSYRHLAGTVWLASDGGIFRSTNGGDEFHPAGSISTLSVVNIAGVAQPGAGPVISLNTGDNDGYVTNDGGQLWNPMNYGGGDNDTSWSDPLRPQSMLVFTPRRDANGAIVGSGLGQTVSVYEVGVGKLPDVSTANDLQVVPGPSLRPGSTLWNASSFFGNRGFRPIVPNLPGDDPGQPGDYVFIRFFGNFNSPELSFPNNLAVLLRARRLREITSREDWDTPGGVAGRPARTPARRRDRRRPRGHRRVRPGRGVDGARRIRRLVLRSAFRAGRPRCRVGVAGGQARAAARRSDRRRQGRHRRLRRRRGVRGLQQRGRLVLLHAGAGGARLRLRPGVAGRPARAPGRQRHAGRPGRHHRVR
jgi:hypothetical protein